MNPRLFRILRDGNTVVAHFEPALQARRHRSPEVIAMVRKELLERSHAGQDLEYRIGDEIVTRWDAL